MHDKQSRPSLKNYPNTTPIVKGVTDAMTTVDITELTPRSTGRTTLDSIFYNIAISSLEGVPTKMAINILEIHYQS